MWIACTTNSLGGLRLTTRPVFTVIVAYGAADELERCLACLDRRRKVLVVDNSSSAAVRTVAERRGAIYTDSGSNIGFGRGANVGLRRVQAGSPHDVLLLNPDALLDPKNLYTLASYLHRPENQKVGALSPRLINGDGRAKRASWPFPTPWRACAEAVGLGRLPPRHSFVIGAVLMLRWEALQDVGVFDERFFLYAEETDWQRRAGACGWTSAVCPDAVAAHRGAGASEDPFRQQALFHAGQETYIRKWYGPLGWIIYRTAACIGAAVRAVVLAGDRRSEAAYRARLYFRGPRRCVTDARM